MKRKTYTITYDDKIQRTAHTWNSSLRAVVDIVRSLLNDNETAELFSRSYHRNMDGQYYKGSEIWHTSQGRCFVFEIKQTG